MSLRYHFRGGDAQQLRQLRAAAAGAIASELARPDAPAGAMPAAYPLIRAVVAGVRAFPALTLAAGVSGAVVLDSSTADRWRDPVAADWLDGDGTPWSYLCASLLRREVMAATAPARAAGVDAQLPAWQLQQLLDVPPPEAPHWRWRGPAPEDWRLLVMEDARRVLVRFHTVAPAPGVALLRHEDWYRRGGGYGAQVGIHALADWDAAAPPPPGAPAASVP